MLKVSSYFPYTVTIDGEAIELRIKRMTLGEHSDFVAAQTKSGLPSWVRFVSRAPTGPEQERDEKGKYKIKLETLIAEKLQTLGPEKYSDYEAAEADREAISREHIANTFEKYVTVAGGLLELLDDGTEQSIKEGADFLRIFGARTDIISVVLAAVSTENQLSIEKKRELKLRSDSSSSSTGPDPDPDGTKPETTVKNVPIGDYAPSGDVAEKTEPDPSGPTDHGSSSDAPFSI